jgi:HD-like signal output (HDOD) protein
MPELCRELIEECRSQGELLHRKEKERLGFDHAEVGGTLLRRWKIPPRVAEPVQFHHACSGGGQYPRESSILNFADIIAHALELGHSGEVNVPVLDPEVWERLHLSTYNLAPLVKQLDDSFAETVRVLFEEDADE